MEIPIHAIFPRRIQIIDFQVATRDDVVMTQQNPRNRTQEYLIAGKERYENTSRAEKVPGIDSVGYDRADEEALADG
jgi:hypothetical protein